MTFSIAKWQVWIKNYNPSFCRFLAEYNTRAEAEAVAISLDHQYWDEPTGECGLEVVRVSKPLFDTEV